MSERYDRRVFLRRLTAAGLAAQAVSTLGCGFEEIRREGTGRGFAGRSLTRPVLLPWTGDAVRIGAPLSELPAAYVSRGSQRVFIELDSRIELQVMLAAHISVSTGHWRIPLPGDDLGIPVDAGDALREFEETPIGEWNSKMDPTEGDFRILYGRRETVEVAFSCMPMAARKGWFSAGPWEIAQCAGSGPDLCREDFMDIGTGTRHTRRDIGTCTDPVEPVRYVTWACPEL